MYGDGAMLNFTLVPYTFCIAATVVLSLTHTGDRGDYQGATATHHTYLSL